MQVLFESFHLAVFLAIASLRNMIDFNQPLKIVINDNN